MCQSKQMFLIGLIFAICLIAALSLTIAYFELWHYRGGGHKTPAYQIGKTIQTNVL